MTYNIESTEETPTLSKYDFIKLPQANALIPVNPIRLPHYTLGSIAGQNLKTSDGIMQKPVENLKDAATYVKTSINKVEFLQRVAEVTADTVAVNAIAEVPSLVSPVQGAGAAGIYANNAAKRYKRKMKAVDTDQRRYILKKRNILENVIEA